MQDRSTWGGPLPRASLSTKTPCRSHAVRSILCPLEADLETQSAWMEYLEHFQSTSGDSSFTDFRGVSMSSCSSSFLESPFASGSGIGGFDTLISIRCSSTSSSVVPSGIFDCSRLFSTSKYRAQKFPSSTAIKPSHPPSVSLRSCLVQSNGALKFGSAPSRVPNLTS